MQQYKHWKICNYRLLISMNTKDQQWFYLYWIHSKFTAHVNLVLPNTWDQTFKINTITLKLFLNEFILVNVIGIKISSIHSCVGNSIPKWKAINRVKDNLIIWKPPGEVVKSTKSKVGLLDHSPSSDTSAWSWVNIWLLCHLISLCLIHLLISKMRIIKTICLTGFSKH